MSEYNLYSVKNKYQHNTVVLYYPLLYLSLLVYFENMKVISFVICLYILIGTGQFTKHHYSHFFC